MTYLSCQGEPRARPSVLPPQVSGWSPSASLLGACSKPVKPATATLSLEGVSFCVILLLWSDWARVGARAQPGDSADSFWTLLGDRATPTPCSLSATGTCRLRAVDPRRSLCGKRKETQRRGGAAPEHPGMLGRGSPSGTARAAAYSLQTGLSGHLCASRGYTLKETWKDVLGFQGYLK